MKKNRRSGCIYSAGAVLIILICVYIFSARFSESPLRAAPLIIIFTGTVLAGILIAGSDKRNIEKKTKYHRIFGEMNYYYGYWHTERTAALILWSRTYNVRCEFAADSENDDISEIQIRAYNECAETTDEECSEIEEIIESCYTDHFGLTDRQMLISEFRPFAFQFAEDGRYVLSGAGPENDCGHSSFVQIIRPQLEIMTDEMYYDRFIRPNKAGQ